MSNDAGAVLKRWFDEVWNEGREETIDELFGTGGVAHGLGESDPQVNGPEEFKVFFRNMRSAFPDVRIHIEDMVVEGEKVAARLVLEATHAGEGLGVPATGRRVRVAGITIGRISGGKLQEGWNSWDQLGLLRQMGALPAADGRDRFTDTPK